MKHQDIIIPNAPAWRLRRARVPQSLLATAIPGAPPDQDGECLLDLAIADGRVTEIAPAQAGAAPAENDIDVEGRMVWPTLVDMHTHLDKGEVIPRVRANGTIREGSLKNGEDHARWTREDITRRMRFGLRCAYVQGVSAIRTHLDYRGPRAAESWEVFDAMREEWRGRIDLQAVGLAVMDLYSTPAGEAYAALIAEHGGVLGGVTDVLARDSASPGAVMDQWLDRFFELAGLPNIARAVLRTGFSGRVVVGHCVNLALQTDEVAKRTLDLCVEARLAFVTLPTPMMYLQERQPGRTPRWRGVTLAHEIRAAGLPLAIAGDNCRDSWYAYGDHDMVDSFPRQELERGAQPPAIRPHRARPRPAHRGAAARLHGTRLSCARIIGIKDSLSRQARKTRYQRPWRNRSSGLPRGCAKSHTAGRPASC
jgi:cytosine deaminase